MVSNTNNAVNNTKHNSRNSTNSTLLAIIKRIFVRRALHRWPFHPIAAQQTAAIINYRVPPLCSTPTGYRQITPCFSFWCLRWAGAALFCTSTVESTIHSNKIGKITIRTTEFRTVRIQVNVVYFISYICVLFIVDTSIVVCWVLLCRGGVVCYCWNSSTLWSSTTGCFGAVIETHPDALYTCGYCPRRYIGDVYGPGLHSASKIPFWACCRWKFAPSMSSVLCPIPSWHPSASNILSEARFKLYDVDLLFYCVVFSHKKLKLRRKLFYKYIYIYELLC